MVDALVEYDYVAEQDDELTLKAGDIITNVNKLDGGWWEGTVNGKRGMFPDNFVKEIKQPTKDTKKTKTDPKGSHVHKLAENLQNQISLDAAGPPKRPGGGNTARKKLRAKVSFSYAPQNEDELELKIGEIIEIENKEEDGWWEGTVRGKRGVFPANFVDLVDEDATPSADLNESQDEEVKEIKGKKPKGFGFGNIFADGGGADVLHRMKKKQSADDAKTEPKVNGKKPATKEAPKEPPPLPSREELKPALPKQPPVPPVKLKPAVVATPDEEAQVEKAKVLFPYAAENDDELSLEEGQIIVVLDKELEDSGWWRGEINGVCGVFPDNFVELLPPEEKPKRPAPPAPLGKTKPLPPQPEREGAKKEAKDGQKEPVSKKPGPPLLTKKPTTKHADPKLIAQTDDHKVQEQKTGLYIDTAEPNPPLKHPNKDRPKAPTKRPPTKSIRGLSKGESDTQPKIPERPSSYHRPAPEPPIVSNRSSTPLEKLSLKPIKKSKKESSPEAESHNGPAAPQERAMVPAAKADSMSPRSAKTDKEGAAHASSAEVAQLRQELENLRSNSVPRKQYEQLQTQVNQLKVQMEDMKKALEKKIYNVMAEVDEEKKLRLNALVEMERVKKLVAPQ